MFIALGLMVLGGGYTTLKFYYRLLQAKGRTRTMWLVLMSLTGGGMGWTVHFTAIMMLEFDAALTFEPWKMLFSFLIAACCLGFAIGSTLRVSRPYWAVTMALVTSTMVLMSTFFSIATAQVQGTIEFDFLILILCFLCVFLYCFLGTKLIVSVPGHAASSFGGFLLCSSPALMDASLRIASRIIIDPSLPVPAGISPGDTLVILNIGVATLILLASSGALAIDRAIVKAAAEQYKKLALHDSLTGLPNRVNLDEFLEKCLMRLPSGSKQTAVLALDFDRFKPINDLHGHAVGDKLLVTVARRVTSVLRANENFGRVGGDEFLAIKSDITSKGDVVEFEARIREMIEEPIRIEKETVGVGVSTGAALAPDDGITREILLARADLALYRAKHRGRCQLCFFEPGMDEAAQNRSMLTLELRTALKQGEFRLLFQPQIRLETMEVLGFEALLRWHHPTRGLVEPMEFIPFAEESNLINDIGSWVLNEASRIASNWPSQYKVAVNISPQQLIVSDFVETVQDALLNSNLAPGRLEIEVTEASVIKDLDLTLQVMKQLKSLGVHLAMDDYGTGYASLGMLKALPFDRIKIDRSFITNIENDPISEAIVRSTIMLAKALKTPVLAEGVETKEQADLLRLVGCDEVQGNYFGTPETAKDLWAMLTKTDASSVPFPKLVNVVPLKTD